MSAQQTEGAVRSADGTSIGYVRIGSGPAVVIVHGSLATGEQWLPAARALAERFTCFVMDRRGRGRSADSAEHSLSKECEDIGAVLAAAGPGAALLGHSYGGICALETACRVSVPRLVLYEPPLPVHAPVVGPALQAFRAALARREPEEALAIGLRSFVRVRAAQLAALRSSSRWREMVALTPVWLRELEAMAALEVGVTRFKAMRSPTLLLVGPETEAHHMEASRALAETLPDARLVELPGQGHFAHVMASADVAAALGAFLSERGE